MDETEVDALIDDLEASYEWRDDAAEVVRDLLARLVVAPATEVQRARLVLLSVNDIVRDHGTADASTVVMALRQRAMASDDRSLQARAERVLSHLFFEVGDPSAALEHAVTALALDDDALPPALRCRIRLAMADALDEHGSIDDARPRYRDALGHARSLGAPWLSMAVLNNWACAELLAGDPVAAWSLAEQMQALIAEHHATVMPVYAGTIAEILHVLGRSADALTMLRRCLLGTSRRSVFDRAGAYLVLAQIEREVGALDAAQASLDAADRLTTTHELHGLRVEAVGARAELLAARGDHAGAYETHVRFHDQTLALRSATADARAQTQHAMYEADTARNESARYREMSYRDPLTQLYNRRHVDADLDHRLARGDGLTVAMVDLDHFKTVNDTFSHAAGDAVLIRIAALLTDAARAVSSGSYAARLGGEEFLLALPHHDLAAAHAVAETLRQTIATTDWTDIAPGLPVTASIGLATTPRQNQPPLDRACLLRQADHHLYAAKAGGRDRVEPGTARDLPDSLKDDAGGDDDRC